MTDYADIHAAIHLGTDLEQICARAQFIAEFAEISCSLPCKDARACSTCPITTCIGNGSVSQEAIDQYFSDHPELLL